MNPVSKSQQQHFLFRLDFALRGHVAYTAPHDLSDLVKLVEHTVFSLGAPLLRYLEHRQGQEFFSKSPAAVLTIRPKRLPVAGITHSSPVHPQAPIVTDGKDSPHQQQGVGAMSLFNTILEKLGLTAVSVASSQSAPTATSTPNSASPNPNNPPQTGAAPASIQAVDVTAKLDQLAATNGQKLNWKTSIVDLLKLLNLDSSLDARKKLAKELGYAGSSDDSAAMNMWLHRTVLRKIADNGGNVPKDLL